MLVLQNVRKQHARAGLQWAFKSLLQAIGVAAGAFAGGPVVGKGKPGFVKIGRLGIIGISSV